MNIQKNTNYSIIPPNRRAINSTNLVPVLINKVDPTIHEGHTVKLVFDYEQDAYGCSTVNVLRTGTVKYPYLTVHVNNFQQPIDIPYYAVQKIQNLYSIV